MSASSLPRPIGASVSRVTIIDHGPRLLRREDPDVSQEVRRILEAEGVEVLLAAEIERVEGLSGKHKSIDVRTSGGMRTIEGTDILVAAGRTPNTRGIGREEAGITLTGRGYIQVNDRLETTAPGIWAIGECAGSPQFTHARSRSGTLSRRPHPASLRAYRLRLRVGSDTAPQGR